MTIQRSISKTITNRLTRREFIMIALMMLAIEAFLLGSYVVVPSWNEYVQIKEANDTKSVLAEKLKADFNRTESYKQELEKMKSEQGQWKSAIPAYISQEEAMLLLDKNSINALLQINLIGFEATTVMQSDVFLSDAPVTAQNDKTAQSIEMPTLSGDAAAKEQLKTPLVVDQTIVLSFTGGYDSVYSFIKSLENNLRKVFVKSIALSSAETGKLSGTMTLSFLSYVDAGNYEQYIMDIPELQGKTNPFAPYAGFSQDGKQAETGITTDPDFYVLLNSYLDNAQKIIMGEYPKADTEIYSNQNAETAAKLVISGEGSNISYTMSLGSVSRTSTESLKVKDGVVRVKIVSLARKDAKDLVGMVLDVENRSAVPVEVQVLFDDKDKPRVRPGTIAGNVELR